MLNLARAILCALALLATSSANAQDYEIRFVRPTPIGYSYELDATATLSQKMNVSSGGKIAQSENSATRVALKGTVIVLEVDETMRPTMLSLLVDSCKITQEGKESREETIPSGTEVLAQLRDGKETFLVNNESASDLHVKVFDLFISVSKLPSTDDDAFAPKERKKIGDRWPVNTKAVAESISQAGIPIAADDLEGNVEVEQFVNAGGKDCLRLKVTIETDKLIPPLPNGLTVQSANTLIDVTGDFPIDVTLGRRADNRKMTMTVVATGRVQQGSPYVEVAMELSETVQQKLTPLTE